MRSRISAFALALILAAPLLAGLAAVPARADDDKQMAEHKITQAKSYVPLDPMYATILDNGRPVGLLLVAIGLNCAYRLSMRCPFCAMPICAI
jgi:hypothetical protein